MTPEQENAIRDFVRTHVPPPGYDARERERDLLAALDAERTRNRELEQFGTIRSRREAEARAKNAEAALDAERARNIDALILANDLISYSGLREKVRLREDQSEYVEAESLIARYEALRAALAVLEEPQ